eukprot:scaffold2334_cov118-Cylindrotheca_fusiformis.AAC.25
MIRSKILSFIIIHKENNLTNQIRAHLVRLGSRQKEHRRRIASMTYHRKTLVWRHCQEHILAVVTFEAKPIQCFQLIERAVRKSSSKLIQLHAKERTGNSLLKKEACFVQKGSS